MSKHHQMHAHKYMYNTHVHAQPLHSQSILGGTMQEEELALSVTIQPNILSALVEQFVDINVLIHSSKRQTMTKGICFLPAKGQLIHVLFCCLHCAQLQDGEVLASTANDVHTNR